MKRIVSVIIGVLTLCTIQAQVQSLKGTWVLKDIQSQDSKERSVSTVKEVPEALFYTCPDKITFEEEDRVCTLHYNNGEEKMAYYLLMEKESAIYFSIPDTTTIPEHQFFLGWDREELEKNLEESASLQLQFPRQEEKAYWEEQYFYNYQLQK